MQDQWTDFALEIESGEPDRVNTVIDEIGNMSLDNRLELFEVCFDDVAERYATADDGYVRQSFVRVAEQLTPGLPTVMALDNDGRTIDADETDVRNQTDILCGFLLEALTDDDGRVRQSAKRGLKDIFRTYDALEDEKTLQALVAELDELAAMESEQKARHLMEAKQDAEFSLQSGVARILEGFQQEFGDPLNLRK